MGVDVAIEEFFQDRYAERAAGLAPLSAAAVALSAARPQANAAALLASLEESVAAARDAVATAATLEELRAILEGFDGCALKATASRTVFADGAAGEQAPGGTRSLRSSMSFLAPGRDDRLRQVRASQDGERDGF